MAACFEALKDGRMFGVNRDYLGAALANGLD